MTSDIPNFKCIVIGDAHTGKSSLIRNFVSKITHDINSNNSYNVLFSSNFGSIAFNIRDTDGQESTGNVRDSFFKNADCALILFDVTASNSYDNVFHWYRRIKSFNNKIPIVLCGNKAHYKSRRISSDKSKLDWEPRMKYFEINNDNASLNEVFQFLAQKLFREGTILTLSKVESEAEISLDSLHNMMDKNAESHKESSE